MRREHWVRRRVHELVDSGVWIALIAVVLTGAAGRALGLRLTASLLALVALGTFAVYTLDHVVDRARDRGAKPRRERFVGRHMGVLLACALVAAGIAGLLAVSEGPEVTLLALLPLHADPEYTGVFVDGALLVGGLGAWLWMS
jgi:4-hydroxybenzoate polyprenyltransferase